LSQTWMILLFKVLTHCLFAPLQLALVCGTMNFAVLQKKAEGLFKPFNFPLLIHFRKHSEGNLNRDACRRTGILLWLMQPLCMTSGFSEVSIAGRFVIHFKVIGIIPKKHVAIHVLPMGVTKFLHTSGYKPFGLNFTT